jgi:O-antigen/teichoic acid export membrane protein
MSRTRKVFNNSKSTALYQISFMLAGFIIPAIILNFYGSEINGLISSINMFIVYFNLVEAGLSGAVIHALYRPLASNDIKGLNQILSASRRFYIKAGYIFVLLIMILAITYPLIVNINTITPYKVGLLVIILGVNGILEFFILAKYKVVLTADQRTYVLSYASTVQVLLNTIIVAVLAIYKVDIVILFLVSLLSILLRSIILVCYVKIKYRQLTFKEKPNFDALDKRWDAFYLQILGAIHSGAPVIILTVVTQDLKLVSVFVIFNMVVVGLNGLLDIFTNGLTASFGEVIAKREIKTLQKAYREFEFFYYCLITVIYSTAFLSIMPFIRIYTNGITDTNYNLPIVGLLFILNGLLFNLKTPQGMLVISAGLFKETKLQTTIQGAIAIIISFIMVPFYGIVGVLVGAIISNIYRDIDLIIFISRNVTKLAIKTTLLRITRIFITLLIIIPTILIFDLKPSSYFSWITTTTFIFLTSFIIVFLVNFVFERENINNIIKRVKIMLSKQSMIGR